MQKAIAIDRAALGGTVLNPRTALPGGRQYALAPELGPLASLFDAGQMAVMLNVGSLVQPARVMKRSIEADSELTFALAGTAALRTVFPAGNSLASQLSMVARMISARTALTAKRQVFFASLGGFDTHNGVLTDHPPA